MKLTGKCADEFRLYLINKVYNFDTYDMFYRLPASMQYGAYVDFFDGVEIYINDYKTLEEFRFIIKLNKLHSKVYLSLDYKTRQETRVGAIEKADEIYNESVIIKPQDE